MISPNVNELTKAIDSIAQNATEQLVARQNQQTVQSHLGTAMRALLVVPCFAIVVQLLRLTVGRPPGTWFSWVWLSLLTVIVSLVWLIQKTLRNQPRVIRDQALAAIDREIGSSDRIVTADQFLKTTNRNGFMQAAIDDAEPWIDRGRHVQLGDDSGPLDLKNMLAIPVAIVFLCTAGWLADRGRTNLTSAVAQTPNSNADVVVAPSQPESETTTTRTPDEPEKEEPRNEPDARRSPSANRSGTTPSEIPSEKDDSKGKLADGETNESQQSATPSNARGEPSSQGQPTKDQTQATKKPNQANKKSDDAERPKDPKPDEQPSGATAGQGSSRGSSKNAASSDWSSRNQASTPDEEPADEEDEVDDEDEEQKARGGVQPNMRDRRPPVNRDLQIGFGNRSDADANGRGGPSAQKKSRGVASLVLGVPIPDRINGQPNKGRTRVTQQRIHPAAEEATPVAAQDRGARSGDVTPVHHPSMEPWLQNLVRNYFLQRRNKAEE